jgi:predicted alpha/beta superfamily hydrolase
MGSSMGGLISLYAICEYPDVFGGAGCVSTHWPVMMKVIQPYLKSELPDPQTHKIYFDHGTVGLDKKYPRHQKKIDGLMREQGFTEGENWITKVYVGDTHHESCWQARIDVPLTFLLGN